MEALVAADNVIAQVTKVFVLVHGFNVKDPEKSIGKVGVVLEAQGYLVERFDYGDAGLIDVRFANENLAYALLSTIRSIKRSYGHVAVDVIPIGHSNGCALIARAGTIAATSPIALSTGAVFKQCIYISPALNKKSALGDGIERCDVLFNEGDNIVSLSAFLLLHQWGAMGRKGYTGKDPRYINHDSSSMIKGHSDWFSAVNIDWTVKEIVKFVGV